MDVDNKLRLIDCSKPLVDASSKVVHENVDDFALDERGDIAHIDRDRILRYVGNAELNVSSFADQYSSVGFCHHLLLVAGYEQETCSNVIVVVNPQNLTLREKFSFKMPDEGKNTNLLPLVIANQDFTVSNYRTMFA